MFKSLLLCYTATRFLIGQFYKINTLRLKELLEEGGFQIVEQSIEKFCLFHFVKI
jgi:hypothetical protein